MIRAFCKHERQNFSQYSPLLQNNFDSLAHDQLQPGSLYVSDMSLGTKLLACLCLLYKVHLYSHIPRTGQCYTNEINIKNITSIFSLYGAALPPGIKGGQQ